MAHFGTSESLKRVAFSAIRFLFLQLPSSNAITHTIEDTIIDNTLCVRKEDGFRRMQKHRGQADPEKGGFSLAWPSAFASSVCGP